MRDQPFVMPFHMRLSPGEMFSFHLEDQGKSDNSDLLGLTQEEYFDFHSGKLRLTPELAGRLESVTGHDVGYWERIERGFQEALPHLHKPSPALLATLEEGEPALARHFLAEQVSKLIRLGMLREAQALLDLPEHQVLAEM